VAHATIDKGVIQEAYQQIAKVHTPEALFKYLQEALNKSKQFGLSPLRKEIEGTLKDYLPQERPPTFQLGQILTKDNLLEVADKLISVLAKSSQRLSPQASEVLSQLVLGRVSASETGKRLLPVIATFQPEVSSDQLVQILNALREFYHDGVNEVVSPLGEVKSNALEKQKALLNKQAQAMTKKEESFQDLQLVPSKSQLDAFAGYIGEDCTKGRWSEEIHRPDTQVYRMIAHGRLQGMVYLKRDSLDGKTVLVIGIEPRARFRVDSEKLLDGLIQELGTLAGKYDYDYILISTNSYQRSNRPDMNDAIEKRFLGQMPLHFQNEVSGNIFSGHDFHMAWKRPEGLPKGEPPPPSIAKVVGHESRTVALPRK
jgi:hypothetical protein